MKQFSPILMAAALVVASGGGAQANVGMLTEQAVAGSQITYSVAFAQPSGLPSGVDQMVTAAGGTIVARLPEIGGIAAVSANPGFATTMAANASVKSVDVAAETSLPIVDAGTDVTSAGNNGGSLRLGPIRSQCQTLSAISSGTRCG
jgi:hypothetical protein